MIGRRGFLGGIIAAVTGGEALVKLASPAEAQLVQVGDPARILQPDVRHMPDFGMGRVYIAVTDGNGISYEAVGWLKSCDVITSVETLNVNEYSAILDRVRQYHPGTKSWTMNVAMNPIREEGKPFG